MFRKYVYHDITWYDFKNPRIEEFLDVATNYSFDKGIVKKFLATQQKTEAILHDDVIFLSLFFPCALDKEKDQIKKKQVRFIVGKDFIFTARSEDIRGFYDLKKKIEEDKTNPLKEKPASTVALTSLLQEVYKHIGDDLEGLHKSLLFTEKHILASKDISKTAVYAMNKKSKDFHKILQTQEEVWMAFDGLCQEFFHDMHTTETLTLIMGKYKKTLGQSGKTIEKKIDHKLLFKRAVTRKKRIRRLQITAFVIVFVTLLFVGTKVL